MQKFYWNNQQSPYSERYRTYQVTREDWCQDFSTLTLAVNPPDSQHACCVQVVNNDQETQDTRATPSANRVVVRLGEPEREYNRTWNERTKFPTSRVEKSVEPNIFNHHDYENVYDDKEFSLKDQKCVSASARNTPRARKKKRAEGRVYRSKSCERVTGMLDKLSEKLSINSDSPPPSSTPTPSLLQSVAARAIPCVDIKPQPESSVYGVVTRQDGCKDIFRPAANLADRMRGRMEYVNKKIKIIRSRSAERLRGYMRPDILPVSPGQEKRYQQSADRSHQLRYNPEPSLLPVLGQARALVSCSPSPYDTDILRYQAGDIIDIIQMNPNGLWRGRCGERTGQFKFINVELVPESRRRRRSRGRSLSKTSGPEPSISNIGDVLRVLDMSDYLPVFVLNGYEDLTLLKDLDEEELDYLGINDLKHREALLNMSGALFPVECDGVMT